ncbi:MAG: hypothetical protein E4G95_03460 [Bacteroidia bacterium]|nr:MAG: hypothetical protein E4G95_03460 [Bacteroidia bacterium]
MKNLLLFFGSVLMAGIMFSCDEVNDTSLNSDITISEDEVAFLKSTEAVGDIIDAASFAGHMAMADNKGGFIRFFPYKDFPECAEVTVSSNGFPKEIIIDYGDDCYTRNDLQITGIITITLTDTITNEGAVMTIIYDGVTIGDKSIDKEATITNEGINDDGNWVMSISSLTTVSYGDTLVITRDYDEQKEWINGFLTPRCFDDQYYLTGGGTITVNDEIVFTRTIIEPLYFDRACRYILSGVVEISRDGESLTIDFGDGECDNIAVVTKDGESEVIELNSCRFGHGFNRQMRHMYRSHGWW